ncbi:MAG: hypothetical protein NC489_27700 [Ruminococcus flavefaciens]|nr:hypothetical protein [Ruminococcus flavefaciens]
MKDCRTNRLLLLFDLFYRYREVEMIEIENYLSAYNLMVSHRTIGRDIRFLKQAGLIQTQYSKKYKAYEPLEAEGFFVPRDGKYRLPELPKERSKVLYMEKIIRLCTLMAEMIIAEVEDPIDWYRKKYKKLSDRTRQRDFKQLREVGYKVSYAAADELGPGEYGYEYPGKYF